MIVAFLQNPWFPAHTHPTLVAKYRDRQDFHKRILGASMTGKRLIAAFGDMYDKIHWDNANWRHTSVANGKMPADPEHIARTLIMHQPEVVLAFGAVAREALEPLVCTYNFILLACPHPSAFGNTSGNLTILAKKIREEYVHLL